MIGLLQNENGVSPEGRLIVNTAALNVSVSLASNLAFVGITGKQYFEALEGVSLQSVLCNIPYGFGQALNPHYIRLAWEDGTGNTQPIPELGGADLSPYGTALIIPSLCDGNPFPGNGLFLRVPDSKRWRLVLTGISLSVSMVNVPTALNGQDIPITYTLQVEHALDMAVAP